MSTPASPGRDALIAAVQQAFSRFQSATDAVDETAAEVLGLSQRDMFCIEILFRVGAMSLEELSAAAGLGRGAIKAVLDRTERAGYARRVPVPGERRAVRIELTEHARQWIETIWGPIAIAGGRMIAGCRTVELRFLLRFLEDGLALQAAEAARIRALLDTPAERPRSQQRGGLSPAALRRVQLYVQANLDRPMRLDDLARRAKLSTYHFARAFKASTGETPRAFIERMRVERAAALLRESDEALAQVALASGFGTQSRMTTVFRKATGMTPARYRRDR